MPRAEDEGQASAALLLVVQHVLGQPRAVGADAELGQAGRKPAAARCAGDALGIAAGEQRPRAAEKPKASAMPDRDRLAVEQAVGKAGLGLQRMAEGVAEVEQGARAAGLALVLGDDRRLGGDARRDRMAARAPASPASSAAPLRLAPGEEVRDRRSAPYLTTSA